jgi:dTDP-4-amino-4,6-dideoxygalactose transaminase
MQYSYKLKFSDPLLPIQKDYTHHLEEIWKSRQLTNYGNKVKQLEQAINKYLKNTSNLFCCSSGTMALAIALKSLDISGEVITTPLSFPATVTSLLWQGITPIFCDVKQDLTIDPDKIESLITKRTKAILAVHLFGQLCDVKKIDFIAKKYNLKVIYDAAHVFGATWGDKSIAHFGDAVAFSFHATKIFHCGEGGGIVINNTSDEQLGKKLINFGFEGENKISLSGTNGKMSELHASLGLTILPMLSKEKAERLEVINYYNQRLLTLNNLVIINQSAQGKQNLYYYSIRFKSANALEKAFQLIRLQKIEVRKYLQPLLSELPFIKSQYDLPCAKLYSETVLNLPLHGRVKLTDAKLLCDIVEKVISDN